MFRINYLIALFFILTVAYNSHAEEKYEVIPGLEHPYLFFSKEDLPEIRQRMEKEPFLTRWNVFLKNADEVVKRPVVHNTLEGQKANARKYLENAGKVAFAYVITREEKYAKRAIEEAVAIVEGTIPTKEGEMVWYNPTSRAWNKGADLNTAELSYGLAMVYDWCYDVLTNEEKVKIKNALVTKGIKQYLHSIERENQDFWVGNTTSNWEGVVSGGMGLGALAIYNESEEARKAAGYAREAIPKFIDHVFLKDGGGHEGIMYARYGELFSLYFMMASQRLFEMDTEFLSKFNQKLAGYWDVYMLAPDYGYANFNNMNKNTFQGLWSQNHSVFGGPNSDINALMENFTPEGDPLLLWAADNGAPRYYWQGASPWYFLWRRGDAAPVRHDQKPPLQKSVLFREAGHAIWQSDNLWLAYNGGWISDRSHNNRDIGSFILVVNKERLVNDPGYGDGDAKHHSTVIINNEDQINGKAGKYLNFDSGKNFHYLATDLTDVYNPDHLNKFIRHFVMVNESYFVIVDEVQVKENASVEWRLQTRHKAVVVDNQHAHIIGENNQLYVINAADDTHTEIVAWEGKNGKLNTVSKKPVQSGNSHLIVSVLFPVAKVSIKQEEFPKILFLDGTLTISDGNKLNDKISFRRMGSRWILSGVNEEKNLTLSDGKNRSIIPYRNKENIDVKIENFPNWFLPISEKTNTIRNFN